jgi:hypothetical protein
MLWYRLFFKLENEEEKEKTIYNGEHNENLASQLQRGEMISIDLRSKIEQHVLL